jgi:hypothetical protein
MKEALNSSETSVLKRATQLNIPEDTILQLSTSPRISMWEWRFLDLGTSWKRVVSFTPLPLGPREILFKKITCIHKIYFAFGL